MKNKFCRICWNSKGWRYPTGEAIESPSSYVGTNGFGHEEWLFNYKWLIDGKKYGFLQPIGKYRDAYVGKHCSVALYTISPSPNSRRFFVGTISELYIPTDDELREAVQIMEEKGWIDEMRRDLGGLPNIQFADLAPGSAKEGYPQFIINVAFKPENVRIYDPKRPIPPSHKLAKVTRYHPYDWPEEEHLDVESVEIHRSNTLRTETKVIRAAQNETTYEPRHVQLQNRLYEYLCSSYGEQNVFYEANYVDLSLKTDDGFVFYEIKMANTAKKCVRQALGQLLEYCHFPNEMRAKKLVVVGDVPPSENEKRYIEFLRSQYLLPIYYAYFDWTNGRVVDEF